MHDTFILTILVCRVKSIFNLRIVVGKYVKANICNVVENGGNFYLDEW